MAYQESFQIRTRGRGTYDITSEVEGIVSRAPEGSGLATVFVHHTSASVIVCENADPTVRRDLDAIFARLVPDGDPIFEHTAEGPDDMPAHVRSVLTATSLGIPVTGGRCGLGTWQGIYLWEHRAHAHSRRVSVTVV